ncbi:MAG: hydantoinase/oxoprolinase family protein [Candidatus Tectomicrobia bacterium]|uniref:Hydantoinase/oxoprolinase family protein n=1 Tax=Tectimicrobiota bacterium TaxID=2528274 RepID=A0A933GLN8_UNCTE|nr:hydantoinase/oxoprolinase family protein [Candidatus Tectomicrobia bacterium]
MKGRNISFGVGIDIGGTFTDIVLLNHEGTLVTRKVSSTPEDYSRGIITGLKEVFSKHGLSGENISVALHACTVATNAVLEHTGAVTGLITTRGFRDVLEIRRFRMPEMFNYHWEKPEPLVPRERRLEVEESIDLEGNILCPLNIEGTKDVIQRLAAKGVESIAISLLNSYANPLHEQKIGELVKKMYPDLLVNCSSELVPVIKEYERTSEVVVNAYVRPVVIKYMSKFARVLKDVGIKAPLLIMQSSGGMMRVEESMRTPFKIIECGPAAGVVGCHHLAEKLGLPNVLTLDMGGTTTKASIIENHEISRASAYEVGAGISMSSRLSAGGGYVIRVASIDIAEIGAGGGSKIWIDVGKALHIGPMSAGAVPGPVCYGLGGEDPTLTDANLVLGYINPEYLAGGTVRLYLARARKAIETRVAKPLNISSVEEVAYGSHMIATSNMVRAVRAVSTVRGRDPRDFILVAYGGAGPIHAALLARELGIKRIIVPPSPGVFSSLGLLFANMEHRVTRPFYHLLNETGLADTANKTWQSLESEVMTEVEEAEYKDVEVDLERFVEARYHGQSSELTIPLPWYPVKTEHIPLLDKSFTDEHLKTYAHKREGEPIELVNIGLAAKIRSRLSPAVETIKPAVSIQEMAMPRGSRKAYFGKYYGWLDTPILNLESLTHDPRKGPAVIELYDATVVVPPFCTFSAGEWGTISIELEKEINHGRS